MSTKTRLAARAASLAAVFLFLPVFAASSFSDQQKAPEASPKKPVTVTSDTMEANRNENVVVFRGNVVAVEDFTLCSDELYIHYDENKEVSEIDAGGNVRIFQQEKTSSSERAVYDRKNRTIVLTGKAEVRQCSDTVRGDRITVYMDDENALVESEKGGRVKAVIMPDKNCKEAGQTAQKGLSEEARCKRSR